MVAYGSTCAAASTVGEQCDISARGESMDFPMSGEEAELSEMIAAAAGTKLRPSPVFVLFSNRADIPIRTQHFVLTAVLEAGAHTKARLRLNRPGEPILVPFQFACGNIKHGHFHAASDIDAHRIRNHRVLGSQHPANRQPVTNVGIRHEGSRHHAPSPSSTDSGAKDSNTRR